MFQISSLTRNLTTRFNIGTSEFRFWKRVSLTPYLGRGSITRFDIPDPTASVRLTILSATALSTQLRPEQGMLPVAVWSQRRRAWRARWPRCYTRHAEHAARYSVRIAQILYHCQPDDYLLVESSWSNSPDNPYTSPGIGTGQGEY